MSVKRSITSVSILIGQLSKCGFICSFLKFGHLAHKCGVFASVFFELIDHELDIRCRQGVLDLVRALRPVGIIHCAAQPSHDRAAMGFNIVNVTMLTAVLIAVIKYRKGKK